MWDTHKVRSGETLGAIARKYHTTVSEILSYKENHIRNRNQLRVGQLIYIPIKVPPHVTHRSAPALAAKTQSEPAVSPNPVVNDTTGNAPVVTDLGDDADDSGVADTKIGDPGDTPVTPTVQPAAAPVDKYHRVVSGDNLGKLARRYGTSVARLKQWNGIGKTDVIRPGHRLVVARARVASKSVTSPNDNPPNAAKPNGADSGTAVAAVNAALTDTVLAVLDGSGSGSVGSQVDEAVVAENGSKSSGDNGSNDFKIYKIKKGDSLWTIALSHNITVADLKRYNNIRNHLALRPGRKLRIPIQ